MVSNHFNVWYFTLFLVSFIFYICSFYVSIFHRECFATHFVCEKSRPNLYILICTWLVSSSYFLHIIKWIMRAEVLMHQNKNIYPWKDLLCCGFILLCRQHRTIPKNDNIFAGNCSHYSIKGWMDENGVKLWLRKCDIDILVAFWLPWCV